MFLLLISFILALRYIFKIKFVLFYFLWVVFYVLSYSILEVSTWVWYYVLPLSVIPIFIISGIPAVNDFPKTRTKRCEVTYLSYFMIILMILFSSKNIFNVFYSQWYAKSMVFLERYETYLEISRFINMHIPVEKSIAMEEIGIIGYYTKNKIVNLFRYTKSGKRNPYGGILGAQPLKTRPNLERTPGNRKLKVFARSRN